MFCCEVGLDLLVHEGFGEVGADLLARGETADFVGCEDGGVIFFLIQVCDGDTGDGVVLIADESARFFRECSAFGDVDDATPAVGDNP